MEQVLRFRSVVYRLAKQDSMVWDGVKPNWDTLERNIFIWLAGEVALIMNALFLSIFSNFLSSFTF
jgi:hypothetical protein